MNISDMYSLKKTRQGNFILCIQRSRICWLPHNFSPKFISILIPSYICSSFPDNPCFPSFASGIFAYWSEISFPASSACGQLSGSPACASLHAGLKTLTRSTHLRLSSTPCRYLRFAPTGALLELRQLTESEHVIKVQQDSIFS